MWTLSPGDHVALGQLLLFSKKDNNTCLIGKWELPETVYKMPGTVSGPYYMFSPFPLKEKILKIYMVFNPLRKKVNILMPILKN